MNPSTFLNHPWLIAKDFLEIAFSDGKFDVVAAKLAPRLEKTWTVKNRDGIAIVPVRGVISRYDSWRVWYSGGTSIEDLATDFTEADKNDAIKAIILDMNTPGGEATGINEFSEMVKTAKTPVYAYVGGQAASGGYWIASAAKKIIADPTAELGSVGVVFAYRKTAEDLVKIVSTVSPKKQLDPASKKGREEIQQRADALADIFISQVAKYRKVSTETVINDFGQGGMLIAKQAIEAGMADSLGSLEGLIKQLQGKYQTQSIYGGYMGLKTDLRALVAGKDDNEVEAAFADLGYAPKTASQDVDLDTVKAEAKEEGKQAGISEGVETGKKDAMGNVTAILDKCELANVSSPKFIKELMDSSPDEAGTKIQAAKADESMNKTIFSTINPMASGDEDLLVADAKKRAEGQG